MAFSSIPQAVALRPEANAVRIRPHFWPALAEFRISLSKRPYSRRTASLSAPRSPSAQAAHRAGPVSPSAAALYRQTYIWSITYNISNPSGYWKAAPTGSGGVGAPPERPVWVVGRVASARALILSPPTARWSWPARPEERSRKDKGMYLPWSLFHVFVCLTRAKEPPQWRPTWNVT